MKKLFLMIAALIIAASGALAQDFTVSARVGMNVAKIGGDVEDLEAKIGLKLGIAGCFPLVDNFYLETGAFYSPKGAKKSSSSEIDVLGVKTKYNEEYTMKLNYLEIPINAVYKYEINSNMSVRGHVGPYFGFGLFGREKLEINGSVDGKILDIDGEESETGYKSKAFSSKEEDCNFKRFDAGINFGGGMEFGPCYLGIQYGVGLSNFNSKNSKDYKMRNGVFSVDFGFNF